MNKLTMSALAATTLFTAPVFAQDAQRNQPTPMPRPAQQQTGAAAVMNDQQVANLWRASKLDGINIYNNNNEKIGEIDDVLLDKSGKAMAVVVDVGGFLGIGTHRVALKFEDVKFADMPRSARTDDRTDRSAATTTTGTASRDANAPAGAPPTSVSADRDSRAGSTAGSTASNMAGRMMPDHAILDMTKEQLKALPQINYRR